MLSGAGSVYSGAVAAAAAQLYSGQGVMPSGHYLSSPPSNSGTYSPPGSLNHSFSSNSSLEHSGGAPVSNSTSPSSPYSHHQHHHHHHLQQQGQSRPSCAMMSSAPEGSWFSSGSMSGGPYEYGSGGNGGGLFHTHSYLTNSPSPSSFYGSRYRLFYIIIFIFLIFEIIF